MKRNRIPAALPIAALLALLAACGRPEVKAAPPRAVRVRLPAPREVGRAARYSGALEAAAQVELAFRMPGRIQSLAEVGAGADRRPIQEGDLVAKGEILARLDVADLHRQRRAAAAAVSSALAQAQAGKNALLQAEREAARARRLFADKDLAQADLDRAETALRAAAANLDAAEAQHRSRQEQLAQTEGAVGDAALRSPLDGVVARRAVDVGELVPPNVPAFVVLDLSELRLLVGVPDTRVNSVRVGQRLPVEVEALEGKRVFGTVSKVAPTAEPALRTYAVELRLAHEPSLRPGMTATAHLEASALGPTLSVPLSAVVRGKGGEGFAAYAVGKQGGRVELRPIEVVDLLENEVLVARGLDASDPVVVEGAQLLREGDVVEVAP